MNKLFSEIRRKEIEERNPARKLFWGVNLIFHDYSKTSAADENNFFPVI